MDVAQLRAIGLPIVRLGTPVRIERKGLATQKDAAVRSAMGAVSPSLVPVMETNGMSIVSKRSAAEAGYFQDQFLSCVACKQRRAPLINRGYWIRFAAVDFVLQWFLHGGALPARRPCQVLSLGAGFDTAFFRLAAAGMLPKDLRYYEVDFAENIERKWAMIRARPELSKYVAPNAAGPGVEFITAPADLRNTAELEASLRSSETRFDFDRPTLVLSEVALAYLNGDDADGVLRWIGAALTSAVVVAYEQVVPEDGFGRVMCRHFTSLGSPILSVDPYPTVERHAERHRAAGLEPIHSLDMNQFLDCLPADERARVFGLEPFDEYEEWRLKCGHYVLACSRTRALSQDPCLARLPNLPLYGSCHSPPSSTTTAFESATAMRKLRVEQQLSRYGHCGCILLGESHLAFIFGGFGPDESGRHGRKSRAHLVDIHAAIDDCGDDSITSREVTDIEGCSVHAATPMYACCSAVEGGVVLTGGRASPTAGANAHLPVSLIRLPRTLESVQPLRVEVQTDMASTRDAVPAARWRHSAVTLPWAPHLVVLFGGRSAETSFSDLWLLDTRSLRWISLDCSSPAMKPSARHSHAAVALAQTQQAQLVASAAADWLPVMLISGGIGDDEAALRDVWTLELPVSLLGSGGDCPEAGCRQARWRPLTLATEGQALLPRFGHVAHFVNSSSLGSVVFVGGVAPTIPGAEAPVEWIELPRDLNQHITVRRGSSIVPQQATDEPYLAHNIRSLMVRPAPLQLLLFGGGGNCFSFGTHLNDRAFVVSIQPPVA